MKKTLIVIAILAATVALSPSGRAAEKRDLVKNGSFEEPSEPIGVTPTDWTYFTSKKNDLIKTDNTHHRTGNQCVRLESQGLPDAYEGLNIELDVNPDKEYTFTCYLKEARDAPMKGGTRGIMVIEWRNDKDKEINRVIGPGWQRNLSRMRWTRESIKKEKPPEGAVKAVFGIHLIEDTPGQGAFLVDDVEILEED
jgi:hypothetical protein